MQDKPTPPTTATDQAPDADAPVDALTLTPTYPDIDAHAEPTPHADAWRSPLAMLKALDTHAKTTHGLAVDKAMFERLHGYLSYHLGEMGYAVKESESDR